MTGSRLSLALDAGAVHLPVSGDIAVCRPPVGTDLSDLPKSRVWIVHGSVPAHSYWAGQGYSLATETPDAVAATIVCLPRSKAQARDLVARALAHGGPVIVDGQKTDGVDAMYRDLGKRAEVSSAFSKAHGKCFQVSGPPSALADWILPELTRTQSGWITAPGLFSADGPDPGSKALVAHLPKTLSGTIADLGAGWGYLAFHILEMQGVGEVHLVEAEHAGIAAARANITDDRARFHWADATTWGGDRSMDHVVANPPFHTGREATPGLGEAFITNAARLLTRQGALWLVANRHLPYEATLKQQFRTVETIAETDGYKVILARTPQISSAPASPKVRPRKRR